MDRKYQDIHIVDDKWFVTFPSQSQRSTIFVARKIQNPLVTIRNGIITIEFVSNNGEQERWTFPCGKGQSIIID